MQLPRVKMTMRRMICVVAIVALSFRIADAVRVSNLAERYRRRADWADRMERRCRMIDAMDDAARAREAEDALDDPFLSNPYWNHEIISWFEGLK